MSADALRFDKLCRIGVELCLTRRRAEVIDLSRVTAPPRGGPRIHLHAADWIVNFFQGRYLRLRDVLSALIMLKREGSILDSKRDGETQGAQHSMDHLSSYLNDHLAGSVGALELLDRLIETYKGKPLERFFRDLRSEIDADQEILKELIARLGGKESAVRKAGAWIVEKLSRAKIQLSETRKGRWGSSSRWKGLPSVFMASGHSGVRWQQHPKQRRTCVARITRRWRSARWNSTTAWKRSGWKSQ